MFKLHAAAMEETMSKPFIIYFIPGFIEHWSNININMIYTCTLCEIFKFLLLSWQYCTHKIKVFITRMDIEILNAYSFAA